MYSKKVDIHIEALGIDVIVDVPCTPETDDDELYLRALQMLRHAINEMVEEFE